MKARRTHQVANLDEFLKVVEMHDTPEPEQSPPPEGVNELNPARIWLSREALVKILEANLTAAGENETLVARTEEERADAALELKQLQAFLEWAKTQPSYLYMALYPDALDDEIDEDPLS